MSTSASSAVSRYSANDLIEKAEEQIAMLQFELAEKFLSRALEMEPDNTNALDAYGELLIQTGDIPRATEALQRSIQLDPNGNFAKYMNIAQLLEGANALEAYRKGCENINRELSIFENRELSAEQADHCAFLRQNLCDALCSSAELYLTDLCFEEDAEQRCGELIEMARNASENAPEPLQLLASYRISQQRPQEALDALQQSYNCWKDIADVNDLPSLAFRQNAAEMFMELGRSEEAVNILQAVVEEEDSVIETWTLLCMALINVNDDDGALECLSHAQELSKKLEQDELDPEMASRLSKLHEELKSREKS